MLILKIDLRNFLPFFSECTTKLCFVAYEAAFRGTKNAPQKTFARHFFHHEARCFMVIYQ
jgi:hypothetical protein